MTSDPPARTRILEAVMTLVDDRGLEGVTFRDAAAMAEVSIGTVQYYCRSKDEMLRMAFEYAIETSLERVSAIPRAGDVPAVMRVAVREFLPLDDRRRKHARVYLAFAARAIVSPALAEAQHGMMVRLRTLCADAYRVAAERSQTRSDDDPNRFGAATVALLDGVTLHLMSDPAGMPDELAVAVAEDHLNKYFELPTVATELPPPHTARRPT